MIFNKDNNGTKELRELTGNYYANNDFSKIIGQIELVTDELITLIGKKVYDRADKAYNEDGEEQPYKSLIRKVQQPIAILATLRMYQRNDLSHEDDGRKFKVASDDTEKLPWQWQLDRDDEMHLEDYYRAVDALIRYLNESDIAEWKETNTYVQMQNLLIRSGKEFDSYFPIDSSERTYIILLPLIREIQIQHTKKAYGSEWDKLLEEDRYSDVRFAACKATALLAMSLALKRLPLSIIPSGVIRRYLAENGSVNSRSAGLRDIKIVSEWMHEDGMQWLDEMKQIRNGGEIHYELLPKNDPKNKYCRL